jgi:hypothetical protein
MEAQLAAPPALTVLNRTVSTIWHNGYEGSTLTYHWWLQRDLLLKSWHPYLS